MKDDEDLGIQRHDFVQSFDRGLAVIRAFSDQSPELTLPEVAELAGITRAAARRFLLTLVELGYAHTDGKRFSLRPTVLEIGNAYLSSTRIGDVALPHMNALLREVHDSSAMCTLVDHEMMYVALARVRPRAPMSLNVTIGTRLPAYPSSMGRVLLAAQSPEWLTDYLARTTLEAFTPKTVTDPHRLKAILDRVRRDGYCIVDQELDHGLRSVAVPVRDLAGRVVAAVNVSMPPARREVKAIVAEVLPVLRRTADGIESDLHAIQRRRASVNEGA